MIGWETVRGEFYLDGSLRDLVVRCTTLADWQRMLDWLQNCPFDVVYQLNGQSAILPSTVSEVFQGQWDEGRRLWIEFEGVQATCHFFGEDEIEFDIDPREVCGQAELEGLFAFMRQLADAVGKDVLLTPENLHEIAIFRARPGFPQVEWTKF